MSVDWQVLGGLCLLLVGVAVNGELYTALAEMEELLETESVLITNLEGYIRVQEDKLSFLKNKMDEYQREHADAASDITAYVSNPINAYLLTKRLTTDWRQVENLMEHDVGTDFLQNLTQYRNVLKFPSDEDLNGAAVALLRLQDTYQLDTSSVARGKLNGIQYSTEMSSDDCFELGRQSYVNNDYHHTVLWMNEAMSRMLEEPLNQTQTFTRADVLEYLAFSTYKEGNVESALVMTNELLQLLPNHERANGNKRFYEKEIAHQKEMKKMKGDDGTDEMPVSDLPVARSDTGELGVKERKSYEMLCRGELKPSPTYMRSLRCRYVTNNVPFLRLGPLKLEEAHKDPYIVIYHDAMYDSEMDLIKRMARPRFRRATVQNSVTGALETANYRISKSAWLKTDEDSVIAKVVQRTADMTGLDMESAEELQVVNYGIGGHYAPHFDFARREEKRAFEGLNLGNRIATVLFYMSDVEQGGATVFTTLRTALWPKRGTAAFWMNLHRDGEGDKRTQHAACPVLTGTKWVSNKWIHERGQEFRRPCALNEDSGDFAI
ncbi:prolyl 4-hydroxylase subunit alpha-1-like [Drosophila madeirensis]|uniref:procollagen-proline 4-dioxygenase n=2 Tax=obscura subgroup TaxID=32357 RepID=A0A3B0JX82_DROGU|nr:prolyl 4-hydroxylase subunit alpha-1-like [Drosophila guanche]XP_034661422.1 prolyl 4-hydroxylase subunit alpha-1-like [Drosophila subobscura]SPP80110.1 blast:Prolyl 4-hydroxylase subunit alpha-1 [Drosophila guanche]